MKSVLRPVWAEIDLSIVQNNVKSIKRLLGNKQLIGVVKADAYGHGATEIAEVLGKVGVSRFAVAMLSEAINLRNNDIKEAIMILGYTPIELADEIINYEIEQTIYDLDYAIKLSEIAIKRGQRIKVHIAIDTGMGRIGFKPEDNSIEIIKKLNSLNGLEIVGIYSHFSTADEKDKTYSYWQYEKITKLINSLNDENIHIPLKHMANSAAIIDLPDTHLDAVRAGIILYGYYPSKEVKYERLELQEALSIKAKISHVKVVDEGTYISYGRKFVTKRKSKIATIPMGYADGYSRQLSNKGKVIINGKFAPIIGTICMDQFMVDITDIDGVKAGDEVIIIGEQNGLKITVDDIAEIINTINYEVICMIKDRIPKVYLFDGNVIKVNNNI